MKIPSRELSSFQAYRSYQHLSQILLRAVIISGLLNIIFAGFLISLFPLKEVQPMLISLSDKANQIIKVEPLERTVPGFEIMMEKLSRHYIILRESFDLISEEKRYQELAQFSSDELNTAFWEVINPEKEKSPLKQRLEKGISRSVIIKHCTSLAPDAPNTYQVEWESEDRQNNEVVERAHWVSTLTVDLDKSETTYEHQYLNPIGFKVTHYNLTRKGSAHD
jgi:type IV secretion system protein VirB8